MSHIFTTIAWKSEIRTAAKFVLVSLADQANDDGVCWPSMAKLCKRVSMTDRAVQRAMLELEELGYMDRKMRPGHSTYYVLRTPERGSEVSQGTPERSTGSPPNVVRGTPERGTGITIKELPIELPIEETASLPENKKQEQERARKKLKTLKTFLDSVPPGERVIPEGHSSIRFAAAAGIPAEFTKLAWWSFKRRYAEDDKRYKDWLTVFRKAIEGNWLKLWYVAEDGIYKLTTVGMQAQAAMSGSQQVAR